MNGIDIRRPSIVRWDSSKPELPFVVASTALKGRLIRVWRTEGFTGTIPRSDWNIIVSTAWPIGRIHHVQNYHVYGYTRYDLEVVELPRISEEGERPVDTFSPPLRPPTPKPPFAK